MSSDPVPSVLPEDSSLMYIIISVCIVVILAFFTFKLYNKVNELNEKINKIYNNFTEPVKSPQIEEVNDVEKPDIKENPNVKERLYGNGDPGPSNATPEK